MIEAENLQRRTLALKRIKRDPVKLTALLYLKEALLTEQYENCKEFIEIAKDFGAQDFEIHYLLEDPRRKPT